MTHTITVKNIKCGGCANSIQKKLSAMAGISNVEIDISEGKVSWTDTSTHQSMEIKEALSKMGYPEGDSTLMQTAKSFVSCAVGRLDKN